MDSSWWRILPLRLPALGNLDGFTLSFTREPVVLPEPGTVAALLPTSQPDHAFIRGHRPMAQGTAVIGGAT
jgi:pyruvate ferredoxin oxidoreductase alpha subunit